jgi:hypothetical protein
VSRCPNPKRKPPINTTTGAGRVVPFGTTMVISMIGVAAGFAVLSMCPVTYLRTAFGNRVESTFVTTKVTAGVCAGVRP